VNVQDTIAPSAICRDLSINVASNGDVSITTLDVDNGSFDNCLSPTLSLSKTSFDCTNLGTNIVTLTATKNGQSSTCTSTVTVSDIIPPVALCKNATVTLDGAGAGSITTTTSDNGSSDNCGLPTLSISDSSFDCVDLGTNTVMLTATKNSQSSTCISYITVQDTTAPTALCKTSVNLPLDAAGKKKINKNKTEIYPWFHCSVYDMIC